MNIHTIKNNKYNGSISVESSSSASILELKEASIDRDAANNNNSAIIVNSKQNVDLNGFSFSTSLNLLREDNTASLISIKNPDEVCVKASFNNLTFNLSDPTDINQRYKEEQLLARINLVGCLIKTVAIEEILPKILPSPNTSITEIRQKRLVKSIKNSFKNVRKKSFFVHHSLSNKEYTEIVMVCLKASVFSDAWRTFGKRTVKDGHTALTNEYMRALNGKFLKESYLSAKFSMKIIFEEIKQSENLQEFFEGITGVDCNILSSYSIINDSFFPSLETCLMLLYSALDVINGSCPIERVRKFWKGVFDDNNASTENECNLQKARSSSFKIAMKNPGNWFYFPVNTK